MKYEAFATNSLNDAVLASPALSGAHLFLRSKSFLFCIDGQTPGPPAMINLLPAPIAARPIERPVPLAKTPAPKVVNAKAATAKNDDDIPIWVWVAVGAFNVLAFLAICVLVGVLLKDRFLAAKEPPQERPKEKNVAPKKSSPHLFFACASCGKNLKVKAEVVGKKSSVRIAAICACPRPRLANLKALLGSTPRKLVTHVFGRARLPPSHVPEMAESNLRLGRASPSRTANGDMGCERASTSDNG